MTLTAGNLVLDSTPDPFYDGNQQPSLDLRFAESKTLNDYVSATPLVDHQRNMNSSVFSPGTFVNSSGLVETAKVNLLPYSKDNLGWSTQDMNNDGAVEGPPGEGRATRFTSVGGTVASRIRYLSSFSTTAGVQYTLSIYVKPLNYNSVSFGLSNMGAGASRSDYNFSTGIVTNAVGTADASMESVGNGWWRLKNTTVTVPVSGNLPTLFLDLGDTAAETHTTAEGFDVYGGQIEEGVDLNTYIQTIGVPSAAPRFDHNPTTGESLGLLIEESRTNLFAFSATFGGWGVSSSGDGSNPTSQTVSISAPDNTTQTRELTFNRTTASTSNTSLFSKGQQLSGASVPTGSIYVKAARQSDIGKIINVYLSQSFAPVAGLQEVTLTDSWQRVSSVGVNVFTTSLVVGLYSGTASTGEVKVLLWGAQLEEGSFATSYIPTNGTALTRSADVASITGSNFSSWYNQSESTALIEIKPKNYSLADLFMFGTNKSFNPSSWGTYQPGANNDYQFYSRISSAYDFNASINNSDAASKLSFGLSGTTYSASYDGNTVTTGSNSGVPTGINTLEFNKGVYGISSIYVKRFTYYPYRLADTRLQSLTA